MSRILLQYLLPLLLPTVIWLAWYGLIGRHRPAAGTQSRVEQGPWFWLVLAGVALLGMSLVYTALTRGFDPHGTYFAPRLEDGRVVPGTVE
jgi:Family of unknown function (DUF6111)